jgi:hypothetical protein
MPTTLRLALPFLAAGQAQKHVTHNDALMDLDALVQLRVAARNMLSPPPAPAEGGIWLLGASPLGDWAGQGGHLAERRDSGWVFHVPRSGWVAWVEDEQVLLIYDGSAWRGVLDGGAPALLTRFGLGTTPDAANPFAAKLNKALWTARGSGEGGDGGLRITLNKEAAGGVLSLLFQSGYSGRAEIGLVGDNDLQFRVSADGTVWQEGLRIDGATGALRLRAGSAAAPALSPAGDSNTGLVFPAADTVAISTGGSENLRVAPGQVLIGTQSSLDPSQAVAARFQIAGTTAGSAAMALGRYSANSASASFNFVKSRAALGGHVAIVSGDQLGAIHFDGDTGTAFELGARIFASADGTPAAGSMPSRLSFATSPSGSATPVERLRIAADGRTSFPTAGTTAAAANAVLDSATGNSLLRSTSSRRYKRDIELLDPAAADRVLDLTPVRYRSAAPQDRAEWSWYGLLAEDVAAVDPRLVHWGYQEDQYDTPAKDGADAGERCLHPGAQLRPDAVQYDRLSVLLIDVVRRQRTTIAGLTARVDALETQAGRGA